MNFSVTKMESRKRAKICTKIYSRLKERWRTLKAACFPETAGHVKFYV